MIPLSIALAIAKPSDNNYQTIFASPTARCI